MTVDELFKAIVDRYPKAFGSKDMARAYHEDYTRFLRRFEGAVLAEAWGNWIGSSQSKFWPRPGELAEACARAPGQRSAKPSRADGDQDLGGRTPQFWVQCHRYVSEKEPVDHADWWTPKTWACARRWLRQHPEWQRQGQHEGWLDTHLFPWLVDGYRAHRAHHFKQHDGNPPGDPPFADWAPPTALLPMWRQQKQASLAALAGAHQGVKRLTDALAGSNETAQSAEDAA